MTKKVQCENPEGISGDSGCTTNHTIHFELPFINSSRTEVDIDEEKLGRAMADDECSGLSEVRANLNLLQSNAQLCLFTIDETAAQLSKTSQEMFGEHPTSLHPVMPPQEEFNKEPIMPQIIKQLEYIDYLLDKLNDFEATLQDNLNEFYARLK